MSALLHPTLHTARQWVCAGRPEISPKQALDAMRRVGLLSDDLELEGTKEHDAC